jgi:hypothetical protein
MRLVERLAVDIASSLAAGMLFALLAGAVAGGAETLEWPGPELHRVATMRLDVVEMGRDADPALASARHAERMAL